MKLKIKISDLLGKYKKSQKWLCDTTGIRPATVNKYYHETISRMNVEDINNIFNEFYKLDNNLKVNDIFEFIED